MKTINWNKVYSMTGAAAVVCAAVGWTFSKASTYAALPDEVTDHERRISTLESQGATNAVRLDDRLNDIDGDLQMIFRRLNRLLPEINFNSATNPTVAKR
jgi:hypothetical protein